MRSWMIGVILGIMLAANLPSLPPKGAESLLCGSGILVLVLGRRGAFCCVAGVLIGLAFGIMHGFSLLERRPAQGCELAVVQLTGVVASLPRVTRVRKGETLQRFELAVDAVVPGSCRGPRTVLLSYYGDRIINPGERWRIESKLKKPWGLANPGSFNIQSWYAQRGIDAVGSVRPDSATLLSTPAGLSSFHHRLRRTIGQRIARIGLSAESKSVLLALTVADRSGLDSRLWGLFSQYGINHLLVISGLHIGLVAGSGLVVGHGLKSLALLAGFHRIVWLLPGLLALVLATAYAGLAGFSLSTNRALVMLAAFVLASFVDRSSGSWNNLLLAGFLVLVIDPLAALGSGFWLSFGAVAWLLWMGLWQRLGNRILRLGYLHTGMFLLMVPMGGWWFGGVSLVAAAANLLMIPVVGMYIVPLALIGVVLQPFLPASGDALLYAAGLPLEHLIPLARNLATQADYMFFWEFSPSLPAVLLALAGIVLLVARPKPEFVVIALMLSGPLLLPRGRSWDESQYLAKLTVLDVGQGTAIVFQDHQKVLVYDTGGGDPAGFNRVTAVVLPYLRGEGITRIDTLVVSHPDNDHSAGAGTLLSSLPVGELLYGGEFPGSEVGRVCRAGQAWRWASGISFQIMSPAREPGLSSNNSSCVLQIQVGKIRLLLPGDIDLAREKQLVRYWRHDLHSDWLLAAHHGSQTSSSIPWLKFVQPERVAFSSGYGNSFGHPHPEIVRRISGSGSDTHSTSTGGALEYMLGADGQTRLRQYRKEHRRYWH